MLAIDQIIYSTPELYSEDKDRTINRYSDPVWYYQNPVAIDPNKLIEIPFRKIFSGLPPLLEVLAKQTLKPNETKYHPWHSVILENGSMIMREGAITAMTRFFSVLIAWYKQSGFQGSLSQLSKGQFDDLMSFSIRVAHDKKQVYSGIRARTPLNKFIVDLQLIQKGFRLGKLVDGISVNIDANYVRETLVHKALNELHPGSDYLKWHVGNKSDGMPVHKSMALLQNTVEFLRSDKTKIFKAIARWTHQGYNINNGRQFEQGWLLNIRSKNPKSQKVMIKELLSEFGVNSIQKLPKSVKTFKLNRRIGAGEYFEYISDITTAVLITLTMLTGVRAKSEFNAIVPSSFTRDKDGNYRFRSEIHKTNQGIGACRYIAGIAAEVVDCITELKAIIDPEGKENLFIVSHQKLNVADGAKEDRPNYADKHLGDRAMLYINRRYNSTVSEDMRIISFKPHSLRHAWAEFALRRFEGDSVPELIRQHFRHAYGSYMTDHYTMGKVFEEDGRVVGRNLLGEIISNAVDGAERLYGPIGEFIHEMINQFEFVGEDEITWMVDQFEGLVEPHEYGFCVLRPDTKTLSKCYDPKTKLPNTGEAVFEKCSGCIHRLSKQVHRDEIMRLGMSLKVSLDSFKEQNLIPLVSVYNNSLKRAVAALKEIDQGVEINV